MESALADVDSMISDALHIRGSKWSRKLLELNLNSYKTIIRAFTSIIREHKESRSKDNSDIITACLTVSKYTYLSSDGWEEKSRMLDAKILKALKKASVSSTFHMEAGLNSKYEILSLSGAIKYHLSQIRKRSRS